jgi:hypothetical protein
MLVHATVAQQCRLSCMGHWLFPNFNKKTNTSWSQLVESTSKVSTNIT